MLLNDQQKKETVIDEDSSRSSSSRVSTINSTDKGMHESELQQGKDISATAIAAEAKRTKMEHEATFLIRQIDAIEMTNKECRLESKRIRDDDVDDRTMKPRTVMFDASVKSGTAKGNGGEPRDDGVSPLQMRTPKTRDPSTTPSAALADDLSTIYDDGGTTPVSAAAIASHHHQQQRIQDLEAQNQRLRDSLLQCNKAVLQIQKNADLKVVRLEWEVARLRQQLADESAVNSKCIVLNQSLRRQLQHVAEDMIKNKNHNPESRNRLLELKQLHRREMTVEKHLNELILSRNQAIRDNTALKRLLLGTCFDCRQKLPVKRRDNGETTVSGAISAGTSSEPNQVAQAKTATAVSSLSTKQQQNAPVPSRPTYQTSTHQVLENLPKQPVAPNFETPPPPPRRCANEVNAQPRKSCLKSTTTAAAASSSSSSSSPNLNASKKKREETTESNIHSPTTTTALLLEVNSSSSKSKLLQAPRLKKPPNAGSMMSARSGSSSISNSNMENRRIHGVALVESSTSSSSAQYSSSSRISDELSSSSSSLPQQRLSPGSRFRHRALDAVAEPGRSGRQRTPSPVKNSALWRNKATTSTNKSSLTTSSLTNDSKTKMTTKTKTLPLITRTTATTTGKSISPSRPKCLSMGSSFNNDSSTNEVETCTSKSRLVVERIEF